MKIGWTKKKSQTVLITEPMCVAFSREKNNPDIYRDRDVLLQIKETRN